MPLTDVANKSLVELFQLADKVRNATSTGYETYLEQTAIALQAAEQIGYGPSEYGSSCAAMAQRKTDKQHVTSRAMYYLDLYGKLFDDAPIGFSPGH